ncbi:DUF481 domain-containing protein [bacterium]|nr:DUF481 domain-containing protein [bacterium]
MRIRCRVLLIVCYLSAGLQAQVNTEVFRLDAGAPGFSVRAGLTATLMAGNTDFQYIGTKTRFNFNRAAGYTFLVTNGGYGSENGKRFFGQALVHLRNVYSLSPVVQMEQFLQFDTDKKRLLSQRYLLGWGYRFKLFKSERVKTRLGASVFYEREDYNLDPDAIHPVHDRGARLNVYGTVLLKISAAASLLNTTYGQPRITDVHDCRILSDFALNVTLGETVDLTAECEVRFDSRPADGIRKMDVMTKLGISLDID